MSWSKITAYWKHNLSALVASSTMTGYNVANLLDRLETTLWRGNTTSEIYITQDSGAGNTHAADSLRIARHNLKTAGATLALQYSTDNFVSDINNAFTPYAPSNDKAIIKEFTQFTKRYSRIKLSGMSAIPFMAIAEWGLKTELDFAFQSFDPHGWKDNDNVNVSQEGHLLGVYKTWKEREINIVFNDEDADFYSKIVDLYNEVDLLNFFVAWEKTDHSTDVWLVRRRPGSRNNPLIIGGARRDITLNLTGRVE